MPGAASSITPTFLFTDIAGSTRLWAEQREAMGAALARHDALLRAVIEDAGGTVFKTVGDAVCAVFPAPLDAVAAAVAGQRALAVEDWAAFGEGFPRLSVRMALHTGLAESRDGDWFGQPLNRVARLLATGHGGQVLVSRATEELVADHLPEGVGLRDLGEHRLKDLARAERVYQLLDPGLPAEFPALRSLDALLNNLPLQLTSFVGREDEQTELRRLLAGQRLVTLTGVGGTGKTRLALQLAAELAEGYPDGAWFVDLAPVTADEAVPGALIAALGLRDDPARPAEQVLAEQLRERRLLVLLDNCEQVVGACAGLVGALLRSCPGLTVLATSREALAIDGEALLPLAPLATPSPAERPRSEAELARFAQQEAVRLFVERARAVVPAFAVTAANAPAIAQVCHRLDGIPLAIELAAARVRALAVEQIAARLDDRLRLLAGGGRDRLPRQQTLRAAIDWSHDLLEPREQATVRRLADFVGAFPLEAAEAVCAAEDLEQWEVLDALDALVARSLVIAVEREGATWYRLLETIRVYAAEKLAQAGEEAAVRGRHLGWYRGMVDEAGVTVLGEASDAALIRLQPLAADVQALVDKQLGQGDEGRDAALDFIDAGWWLFNPQMEVMPLRWMVDRIQPEIARLNRGTVSTHPYVRWLYGTTLASLGRIHEAAEVTDHALQVAEALGNQRLQSWLLQLRGLCWLELDDVDVAEAAYRRAVDIKRLLGDDRDLSIAVCSLAEVARQRGDYVLAASQNEEAISLLAAKDHGTSLMSMIVHNLSQVLLRLGAWRRAEAALAEFLTFDYPIPCTRVSALPAVAHLACQYGARAESARLVGAAEGLLEDLNQREGVVLERVDRQDWDWNIAAVRATLPPEEWEAGVLAGRGMSLEEAMDLARALLAEGSEG